jgi:threonine synthase
LCPQTGAGAAAIMKQQAIGQWPPARGATVLLATAHPAKFPDTVEQVLGVRPDLPARLSDLYDRPEVFDAMPNDLAALKAFIRHRSRAWTP